MIVARELAQSIGATRDGGQRDCAIIRKILAALEIVCIVWNLFRDPALSGNQEPRKTGEWKKRLQSIRPSQLFRAAPKIALVFCHVFEKRQKQLVLRIAAR